MGLIRLPYPHPGQIAVRQQAKRFNWLSAGRRWRKTTMLMSIAVEEAAKGKAILWGAPTYDQVSVGMEEAKKACGQVALFRDGKKEASFPSGGIIKFRSLDDPDNARGHTADGIVIDEVGDVKKAAYYEVLRPMLIDTNGWFWGIGTPRGKNWFWSEYTKALSDPESMAWQVPSFGVKVTEQGLVRDPHPMENPAITFKEMLKSYSTTPQHIFNQEYLAQFIDDSGVVFRYVNEAATAEYRDRTEHAGSCVFGVDWGKVQDFTVIAVLDAWQGELMHIDRFNQIDYSFQVGRLKALADRYKPTTIYAEQNSMGEPLIEMLQREHLPVEPFTTTNASKKEIVEALALAFERREIKVLPDDNLLMELKAFEVERLPSGLIRYAAPEGVHDDCVMALALAWQGVAHPSRGEVFMALGTGGSDW